MKKPTVLSTFLADDIRVEDNGKLIVIGLYTNVKFINPALAQTRGVTVFMALSDISEGIHSLSLNFSDHTAGRAMTTEIQEFQSDGPDYINRLRVELEDFSFPSSGSYSYDIIVDEKEIHTNYISVTYPEPEDS